MDESRRADAADPRAQRLLQDRARPGAAPGGRGDRPPALERPAAPGAAARGHPLRRPAELPLGVDADAARLRPLPEPDRGLVPSCTSTSASAGAAPSWRPRPTTRSPTRLAGAGPGRDPHRRQEAAPGGLQPHPRAFPKGDGTVSRREIREALALPDSTVRRWLAELVELEYLEAEASKQGKAGQTTRYRLVDAARSRTCVLGLLDARGAAVRRLAPNSPLRQTRHTAVAGSHLAEGPRR